MHSFDKLKELSDSVQKIKNIELDQKNKDKSNFNIFTTLLKSNDEVRLHNRFIQKLLDPTENHDCKDIFLKLFIETLQETPPTDHNGNPFYLSKFKEYVPDEFLMGQTEYYQPNYGRFDIYLEFKQSVLTIENKIDAQDQPFQLERYSEYLKKEKKNKLSYLFYLTLDGKHSETGIDGSYMCISYQNHILKWLTKCVDKTKEWPRLQQNISQYKEVVLSLCPISIKLSQGTEMTNLKVFLKNNPSVISNINELVDIRNELFKDELAKFWFELQRQLEMKGIETVVHIDKKSQSFRKNIWEGLIIKKAPNCDFLASLSSQFRIEHRQVWDALYVGLESSNCENEQEKSELRSTYKSFGIDCANSDIHLADAGETYPGTEWLCGRNDISYPFLDTTDEGGLEKIININQKDDEIKQIVDKILTYLDLWQRNFTPSKSVV